MTPAFLRALQTQILATPACDAAVAANDDAAVAAIISAGRTRAKPTEIGSGTIVEVLGLDTANTFLDLITNNNDFRHVKHLLLDGRLRVDSTMVAGLLAGFVQAQVLTQEQADTLLALGREPDPVTAAEVSRALRGPWGDEED